MPTNLDLAGPDPLTVPTLATSVNDWGPDAGGGATTWHVSASSSVNVTGMAGGATNRVRNLVNTGAYPITLKAASSSSAAANRFAIATDIVLTPGATVTFRYVTGTTTGWGTTDASQGAGTNLWPGQGSAPAAPDYGNLSIWSQYYANRLLPTFRGSLTGPMMISPSYARGQIRHWQPQGGASSANPAGSRYAGVTLTGTATGRANAVTNLLTRADRLGIVSSSAAGNFAAARTSGTQMTVGSGTAGVGGFFKLMRFGTSDAATVAGARMFVGINTSVGAPSNVEPSTLTNCVGVGHGASDTNLKIFYGGSSAQTPIDLGAGFPANTLSADLYELILFSPSTSPDVYYQVTRVNSGDSASGQIVNSGATVLPAATAWLNYLQAWRCNNATALAVGLDIVSDYVETDV